MEHKIEAKLVGKRIMVKAQFEEDGEIVHEVNTAFNLGTTEEEIRAEIERQGDLFKQEKSQKAHQKKVDEKFEQAKDVINNLNSK